MAAVRPFALLSLFSELSVCPVVIAITTEHNDRTDKARNKLVE
jgi:hypothetical protein